MFIAHLPAAYLVSRCHPLFSCHRMAFMAGAILPDFDMLVFYLWDNGAVHHHSYLTHRPAFWLLLAGSGFLFKRFRAGRVLGMVGLGALIHMALDSVVGSIAWGWPISDAARPLVVVPATQDWWVMSFVLHWTFVTEILICGLAWHIWRTRVP